MPIPAATRSKAWVYGRSLFGTVGSPAGGMDVCLSPVNVACCQVEVFRMGRSLVQRSPTEYGVRVMEEPHRGGLGPLGLSSHEKNTKCIS